MMYTNAGWRKQPSDLFYTRKFCWQNFCSYTKPISHSRQNPPLFWESYSISAKWSKISAAVWQTSEGT